MRERPTLADYWATIQAAKALVVMADDLRFIGNTESDPFALELAGRLERKATQLLECRFRDETSD